MSSVLRLKSLGGGAAVLGLSTVAHAAVTLVLTTTLGHPGPSATPRDDGVSVEVTSEVQLTPAPEAPAPEPTAASAAGHAAHWPTHTHPYPVPADHDWTPHDPNLVHVHAAPTLDAPAHPQAPAQAAPALTADDDTPSFTIAVSTGDGDAHGAVSSTGTAAPHEESSEPVAEQSVDGPARLVHGFAPSYPEAARTAGIEGDVRLELVVSTSGAVESARVVQGIGHGLDEAALQAVRQFRFAPATREGRAVRVRMGWSMQFRLQ
jgi:periplasmic protein TonB